MECAGSHPAVVRHFRALGQMIDNTPWLELRRRYRGRACQRGEMQPGATIVPVSRAVGGFPGAIEQFEALAAGTSRVFPPAQFANADTVDAHFTTPGAEIWRPLRRHGRTTVEFIPAVVKPGERNSVVGASDGDAIRTQEDRTTGHTRAEPPRDEHLANDVEVFGYQVFNRVRRTCVAGANRVGPPEPSRGASRP